MIICRNMTLIAKILDAIMNLKRIRVVRMKERFIQCPSAGGWRDCMLCFWVANEDIKHICEIQLVHNELLTARKGLPGHVIYNHARNAGELKEMLIYELLQRESHPYFQPALTGLIRKLTLCIASPFSFVCHCSGYFFTLNMCAFFR